MVETKKQAIILDLDNVLFESRFLDQYAPSDPEDIAGWDELASHFDECTPKEWCVNLIKKYRDTHAIIFITSRNDKGNSRLVTEKSIYEATGMRPNDYKLYMRKDGDFKPSALIKKNHYNKRVKQWYKVDFAVDDDISNAVMWNSLGIESMQKII